MRVDDFVREIRDEFPKFSIIAKADSPLSNTSPAAPTQVSAPNQVANTENVTSTGPSVRPPSR